MRTASVAAFVLAPLFALTGCENDNEPETHGFIEVVFSRAESAGETSPYTATTEVQIQMSYDECYRSFYADNPNWRADGEDGVIVFDGDDTVEGWDQRLCSEEVSGRADCTVVEIQQLLDPTASRLRVTYTLNGDLEGRRLLFGPLPLADLTMCEGGRSPRMNVEIGGIVGEAQGNPSWETETANPLDAVPGDQITVRAKLVD